MRPICQSEKAPMASAPSNTLANASNRLVLTEGPASSPPSFFSRRSNRPAKDGVRTPGSAPKGRYFCRDGIQHLSGFYMQ